jgi:hypothetical protein
MFRKISELENNVYGPFLQHGLRQQSLGHQSLGQQSLGQQSLGQQSLRLQSFKNNKYDNTQTIDVSLLSSWNNQNNSVSNNSVSNNSVNIHNRPNIYDITQSDKSDNSINYDISDSVISPFNIKTLQYLFIKLGGKESGNLYPNNQNISFYNSFLNLGAVKQYLYSILEKSNNIMVSKMLNNNYHKNIKRLPFIPGVEVYWINKQNGQWPSLLRVSIEKEIPIIGHGLLEFNKFQDIMYGCLTDIRVDNDNKIITTINGNNSVSWVSINKKADFDHYAKEHPNSELIGYLSKNDPSTPIMNASVETQISSKFPNMCKAVIFNFGTIIEFNKKIEYSITRELKAPILSYEVNQESNLLEEIRYPGLLSYFIQLKGLEYHTRFEERNNVPLKKSFVRLNNKYSGINLTNITFQAWTSLSIPIRFISMPIKEIIFSIYSGRWYIHICSIPINSSIAKLFIDTNLPNGNGAVIDDNICLNKWYMIYVVNKGQYSGVDISIINIAAGTVPAASHIIDTQKQMFYLLDGANNYPAGNKCSINIGACGNMMSTSAFIFDVPWVHFFDYHLDHSQLIKEFKEGWAYTDFPVDNNGNYKVAY